MSKASDLRHQRMLDQIAALPGNNTCADCKRHAPRWASHNLGILLCVTCASVHRKIGTHVTKVKSLDMDTWTKEQIENLRLVGNTKSNQLYNPDERRNPPPANLTDGDRGSELETYIRAKYEKKAFMAKTPPRPASTSASNTLATVPPARAKSTPLVAPNPPKSTPPVPKLPPQPSNSLPSLMSSSSSSSSMMPPPRTSSMASSYTPSIPMQVSTPPVPPLPAVPMQVPSPVPPVPQRLGISQGVLSDMMSIQSPISGPGTPLGISPSPSLRMTNFTNTLQPSTSFPNTTTGFTNSPMSLSTYPSAGMTNPSFSTPSPIGGMSPFSTASPSLPQMSPYGSLTPLGTPSLPSTSSSPFNPNRTTSLPVPTVSNTIPQFPTYTGTPMGGSISSSASPYSLTPSSSLISSAASLTNTSTNPFLQPQQPQSQPQLSLQQPMYGLGAASASPNFMMNQQQQQYVPVVSGNFNTTSTNPFPMSMSTNPFGQPQQQQPLTQQQPIMSGTFPANNSPFAQQPGTVYGGNGMWTGGNSGQF